MKRFLLTTTALVTFLATAISSQAQGTVVFANNGNTKITINGVTMPHGSANGGYKFGLYMGAVGSTDAQLVLVATALNSPVVDGVFNGGSAHVLPSGYASGTQYAFQIRGWSGNDGASYEQAIVSGDAALLAGVSADGLVTPGGGPNPAAALFGTAAGQVQGFDICYLDCPEPSTLALGGLGAAAMLLFRRRK